MRKGDGMDELNDLDPALVRLGIQILSRRSARLLPGRFISPPRQLPSAAVRRDLTERTIEIVPSPLQTFQGRVLPPADQGPSTYHLPVYVKLSPWHPNDLTLDATGGLEVVKAERRLWFDGVAAWWIWAYDWPGGFALPVGT